MNNLLKSWFYVHGRTQHTVLLLINKRPSRVNDPFLRKTINKRLSLLKTPSHREGVYLKYMIVYVTGLYLARFYVTETDSTKIQALWRNFLTEKFQCSQNKTDFF